LRRQEHPDLIETHSWDGEKHDRATFANGFELLEPEFENVGGIRGHDLFVKQVAFDVGVDIILTGKDHVSPMRGFE
jgi:hypothetical protein